MNQEQQSETSKNEDNVPMEIDTCSYPPNVYIQADTPSEEISIESKREKTQTEPPASFLLPVPSSRTLMVVEYNQAMSEQAYTSKGTDYRLNKRSDNFLTFSIHCMIYVSEF